VSDEASALVGQLIENLDPGAFVTKWVLIAEVIGTDGERGVWSETHDEASRWDTYGLLTEAMQTEKARHIAQAVADDGD
jgi:hypothetical protein